MKETGGPRAPLARQGYVVKMVRTGHGAPREIRAMKETGGPRAPLARQDYVVKMAPQAPRATREIEGLGDTRVCATATTRIVKYQGE